MLPRGSRTGDVDGRPPPAAVDLPDRPLPSACRRTSVRLTGRRRAPEARRTIKARVAPASSLHFVPQLGVRRPSSSYCGVAVLGVWLMRYAFFSSTTRHLLRLGMPRSNGSNSSPQGRFLSNPPHVGPAIARGVGYVRRLACGIGRRHRGRDGSSTPVARASGCSTHLRVGGFRDCGCRSLGVRDSAAAAEGWRHDRCT